MTAFIIISLVLYVALIGAFAYGCSKTKPFIASGATPKTHFSIIIPFRNEAQHLPLLLESLEKLDYPRDAFEILFVDDASDDASVSLIEKADSRFRFRVLKNVRQSSSPKKDAIRTAIAVSVSEWCITTDADCEVPGSWLSVLNDFILSKEIEMAVAPVRIANETSFLSVFQQSEMAALQATTMGSFGLNHPFMCNGANFAYTKTFYESLDGFDGNDNKAGGDDVFLLQKALQKAPEKVGYLNSPDAVVTTKSENTWHALFTQRLRWAAKTSAYTSIFAKSTAVIVFAGNFSLVLACFAFGPFSLAFVIAMVVKIAADYVLASRQDRRLPVFYFLLSGICYPFFSTAVALRSFFPGFHWKGRRFTA